MIRSSVCVVINHQGHVHTTQIIFMTTTPDNSIPVENVHCTSDSLASYYSNIVIAHLLRVNFICYSKVVTMVIRIMCIRTVT